MTEFDYIVAGAGPAGCVLANRLSADPGVNVLLVEAGGPDTNPLIAMPRGFGELLGDPTTAWYYPTRPFGPSQRVEHWVRGKTLGGSSSVNGMVYNRGNRADYDALERLGNPGWGWLDHRRDRPAVRGRDRRWHQARLAAPARPQRDRRGTHRVHDGDHPQRQAGQRGQRVPPPGHGPTQLDRRAAHGRRPGGARRRQGGRRAGAPERAGLRGPGRSGGDPGDRRHRHAQDPPALRHRSRGHPAVRRHRRRGGQPERRRPGMLCVAYILRPDSEGSIRITSADPDAPLDIDANYFATEHDRTAAVGAFRGMRHLFATELTTGGCGYHAIGTCAMGPDDDDVVDPRLRVRGVTNLRIVDASVLPIMVSGNLNGPVTALAWRAANFIGE